MMDWWDRINTTLRRLWLAFADRVRIRNRGLKKLSHDIRTCESEDVHVMWEILKKTETEMDVSPAKKRKRPFWNIFMYHPHLSRRF